METQNKGKVLVCGDTNQEKGVGLREHKPRSQTKGISYFSIS